jgi:hypothetical protein
MYISNKAKMPRKSMPYAGSTEWRLGAGKGIKTVNVWFKTGETIQGPFSSSIYVDKTCPTAPAGVGY